MGGRELGYYGPSPDDLGRGALLVIAGVVAFVALVVALCVSDAWRVEPISGYWCAAGCCCEESDACGYDA